MSNSPRLLEITQTADGSVTLYSQDFGQHYHSMHGAIQESEHVFIKEGLSRLNLSPLNLLEIGFGTGLNALLTLCASKSRDIKVQYHALELHPISEDIWKALDYQLLHEKELRDYFMEMHTLPWDDNEHELCTSFSLRKRREDLLKSTFEANTYDLVYFDAFGPGCQPEMWSREVLAKVTSSMRPGGVLSTYCCKGDVRRTLLDLGMQVDKVPGPPGKREMLVATKP